MSYEGLEEARAKRAAEEKATAGQGRGKRDRKHKSPTAEAEAEAGQSLPKNKVARMSEVLEPAKRSGALGKPPVARMY